MEFRPRVLFRKPCPARAAQALCLLLLLAVLPLSTPAEMLFERGANWRWRPGTNEASNPLASWREPGFDDSEFTTAPTPFWYGDVYPGGTQITGMQGIYLCQFLRKSFIITNVTQVASLQLGAIVDDGFVAWINGVEVQRVNMSDPPGTPVTIDTLAANAAEPVAFVPYDLPPPSTYLVTGTNVLAVQVFQSSLGSSDLGFDASLEAVFREPPATNLPPVVAGITPPPGANVRVLTEVTVLLNKPVQGVDAGDLLVNRIPAASVSTITPSQYAFRFPEPAPGGVELAWAVSHGIQDLDSPPKPFGGGSWTYRLDPSGVEQPLYISEFMASNTRTLADENGDFSDWIEIYNPNTGTVNLDGWSLTDSTNNLAKWRFPATNLAGGRFLVVFASEKDRRNPGGRLHANFRLTASGEYLALVKDQGATVVSEFSPAYPPQVPDVSYGFEQFGEAPLLTAATNGAYFIRPTPGGVNTAGSRAPGPVLLNVRHAPNVPLDNEDLTVTAQVLPSFSGVGGVTLRYRVMFGGEIAVPMLDDGAHGDGAPNDGVYGATIPASASSSGQMLRYFVSAADLGGGVSRWPLYTDPVGGPQYLGTVVNPSYVTSSIPIIHLFAQPNVLQPGPNTATIGADSQGGSRGVSVFYDGEFYDNIYVALRGNTTAGYSKKSHRFEFNREHLFRHPGVGFGWPEKPGPRIRRTSFVADYPDPTYMRQGLSFWLCDQIGVPASFYYPVRLQLNGQFYQLANHNDVQTEELLDRLGYDPNGALYNAAGTIEPNQNSTGGFEKKTREWEGNADYQQLANAISEILPLATRRINAFEMLDLPNVINYLVAARIAQENDDVWANMSIYHDNDGDNLWRVVPFDMNLSWGAFFLDNPSLEQGIQATNDNHKSFPLYGSSQALSLTSGSYNRIYDVIFDVPETIEMFRRRMRVVLDAMVLPPGSAPGASAVEKKVLAWRDLILAEGQTDRAKWSWPGLGGQNNLPPADVATGVNELLNKFLAPRRQHFYGKHSVTNTALPVGTSKTQNAGFSLPQPLEAALSVLAVDFNPASGNQDEEFVCLTNSASIALDVSAWSLEGAIDFTFAPGTVVPSRSAVYGSPNGRAFRSRSTSPRGREGRFVVGPYSGRLSARGESIRVLNQAGALLSTYSYPGAPSPAQQFLRVTEIMYHPVGTPGDTTSAEEFEFIELRNTSATTTLDLAGVRFTNGVTFNFTGSRITNLAPGATVLVVRNMARFVERYGTALPVAGQYSGALNNGGDRLRLVDATGEEILDFRYNNQWHPTTDGGGYSLVVVDETAAPDAWGDRANWKPSTELNGSPGDQLPSHAPIIVLPPLSQSVAAGSTVVLSVTITNDATLPITFGIRRNGLPLEGALPTLDGYTAFYSITNAQPSFTNYQFAVSNPALPTGLLSAPALLTFLADSDGDGLPDDWEKLHGLDPQADDARLDLDGDTLSNLDEYLAGTNPSDATSYLKILKFSYRPGFTLEFLALSNRTYSVEFTDGVGNPTWRKWLDYPARPASQQVVVEDPVAGTNRFYRLVTPRRP